MANNDRMKFSDWVNGQRGRSLAIAQAVGVTPPVVSDWVTGKKGIPMERCTAIERATGGAVTRKDLRPDDWQVHWPELAQALVNTTQPAIETVAPPVKAIQDAEPHSTDPVRIGGQRRQGGRRQQFLMVKGM